MSDPTCDVTIRAATEADLPQLYALAREALILDRFTIDLLREKLFAGRRAAEFSWSVYLAEQGGRPVGFMQSAVRAAIGRAWVGLFAVAADFRRRGIASALLNRARDDWPANPELIEVLAIPCNYFAPGLDPRYTAAVGFLEKAGFERFRDCVNMRAVLNARRDTTAECEALAAAGIEVRRARRGDDETLERFFSAHFGADWRFEAHLAMQVSPPALHLALVDGEIIAFSAHSTQNREWGFFGPMGTSPAARGRGLGRLLLIHCLNDLYDAGHRTAVIPWVGPIRFYSDAVGAVVERVFWRYRRPAPISGAT